MFYKLYHMPKISIIIPTYNGSRFINRAISSVLNQTYTDWELLIIDDNSTDNTAELVNEFAKQDQRIKLYKTSQNSGGPALPKNIGLENAKGEYVAFLDHDDEWLPEKLEKQLKIFEESSDKNLGLVSCFINIRNGNGNLILKHKKFYKGDVIKHLAINNFILTCSCVMTKLNILKEVGLFDLRFKRADDVDMWLKISEAGYHFDFTPEYLINYFIHGENYSSSNNNGVKEFELNYQNHKNSYDKYNPYGLGYYYFYKKNYKLSRKYLIRTMFLKESSSEKKIKSLVFIILTFFPNLESFFRNIFSKLFKKLK